MNLQEATQQHMPAIVRTAVPVLYALLARIGLTPILTDLGISEEFVNNALATLVALVIYMLVRVLERHSDKWGWLLGYPAAPNYNNGRVVPGEVAFADDEVLGDEFDEDWDYASEPA